MSVENILRDLVAQQLGVDKKHITRDASFSSDLGTDSLDFTEIIEMTGGSMRCRIPLVLRKPVEVETVKAKKISALDIIKEELPGMYGYALQDKSLKKIKYCSVCRVEIK